ncbi:cytokinesis protein sepA isoform X2 [Callorhinchus milii]|nr:cytokinesis protein sepA isoform X2 [Callorhinchus milii]
MARGGRGDFGALKDHSLPVRCGPPGRGGPLGRDGQGQAAANGYGPVRSGIGNARIHPYPDHRGPRGGRDGPPGHGPLIRGEIECHFSGREDFPFPPPPRFRGGPPLPPPPPPPGTMGFRGRHPFPRSRGMRSGPRGDFRSPRGFPNGPGVPPPPPVRGQRWPGPPGGRRF